ncbi:MAG TPA: urease accessory protein UreD [Steroidobacteraceae bacterium]|nr:urease accessory protein UreD [Steroidobacteraceae bacterium]
MSAATPLNPIDQARSAKQWNARLDLRLERRDARTILAHNEHTGPLQVQKALFPEGPAVCHLAILHPPGGIVAGDRLIIDAALGRGAAALMTTPGASKWYRSQGALAEQRLQFCLGAEAVLEWLPRETIFFDGSRATLSLEVNLDHAAKFFGWEILCFGRTAAGERWRTGSIALRSRIRSAGSLIWSESANLLANDAFFASPVGLAECTVSGTFLAAGVGADPSLLAACRAVGNDGEGNKGDFGARRGITMLPRVMVARYLGHSSQQAFHWFGSLWSLLRPKLLGTAARAPRLWAT